jgi:hypothetical protein
VIGDARPRRTEPTPSAPPPATQGLAPQPTIETDPGLPKPVVRPTAGRWLVLLTAVVAGGLLLGAVAAALSAPLRHSPAVGATPLPAGSARAVGGEATDLPGDRPAGAAGVAAPGGRAGEAPGSGGSRGASRPAAGVIASVDGDMMIVNTPEGPVRVRVGDTTSVLKQVPAERGELTAGQRVLVSGERDGDGAVTASGVQILSGDATGDRAPSFAPTAGGERGSAGPSREGRGPR